MLTNRQWEFIEPLIPKAEKSDPRGRNRKDPRDVMEGILWVLRTGAQWNELPKKYPSYQTCHRYFQTWVKKRVLDRILKKLAQDLKDTGQLDLSECFIDGSFAGAKKGGYVLDLLSVERELKSWQSQTAMVFQSPYVSKQPLLTKRSWLKGPLIVDSSIEIHDDW